MSPAPDTRCAQPGCDGELVAGRCQACGTVAARSVTEPTLRGRGPARGHETHVTPAPSNPSTAPTASTQRRLVAGVVELPQQPAGDPVAALIADPQVPEEKRFCGHPECGAPVGRARDGQPALLEGFCSRDRTPFSFRPKLLPGDLVGGQYAVKGCIAHGGLGWIHLAQDRNVNDKWVALKGLLNTSDPDAREAAFAERQFLAELDHPNIVRIINFAEHGNDGYIVMDYVPGKSLRAILDDRRQANGGVSDPLPVAHAIGFVLEVLPAFSYLHGRGILYCDLKPDNVMHTGSTVRLIDLGAACRAGEPLTALYGTPGYQAPEIAQRGPSVASDLFTVGRTLAALCTIVDRSQHEYTLPTPDGEPLYARYDSLYRFLLKATALDPDERFRSAEEMAAQLTGVLREVVAHETGTPRPGTSECFTVELRSAPSGPDVRALPAILVSADDPAAGFLASLPADAGDDAIAHLDAFPEPSPEIELRRARLLIDAGRHDEAEAVLAQVAALDPRDWRVHWYRGLAHLDTDAPHRAIPELATVYGAVPGELAPKLALAFAYDASGDRVRAAHWYEIVARTDPGYTSACLGLARARCGSGDRAGAVEAHDLVPTSSSAFVTAQLAKAHVLLGDGIVVTVAELEAAARATEHVPRGSRERAELDARVLEMALVVLDREGQAGVPDTVLGDAFTEPELRFALERAYRGLARFAPSVSRRIELVDRANAARPRTLL